ncbi:hypothetical protein D3C84_799890 [compost metagenome]
MTVAAAGFFGEGDIGHVRPGLHGQGCLAFLLRTELAEAADPMLVHGAGRGGRQESVGQLDLAAAVTVLVSRTVAQQLSGRLVDGVRRFAVDGQVAAPVVLVAETIDLVERITGSRQ